MKFVIVEGAGYSQVQALPKGGKFCNGQPGLRLKVTRIAQRAKNICAGPSYDPNVYGKDYQAPGSEEPALEVNLRIHSVLHKFHGSQRRECRCVIRLNDKVESFWIGMSTYYKAEKVFARRIVKGRIRLTDCCEYAFFVVPGEGTKLNTETN